MNNIKQVLVFSKNNLWKIVLLYLITVILEMLGISMFFPLFVNDNNAISDSLNQVFTFLNIENSVESILYLMLSVFILKGLIGQFTDIVLANIITKMSYDIRIKIFNSYFKTNYTTTLKYKKGSIVNVISKEVEVLVQSITHFANSMNLLLTSLGYIAFALYIDNIMSGIFFFFAFIMGIIFKKYGKLARKSSLDFVQNNTYINQKMIEYLQAEKYFQVVGLSEKIKHIIFDIFNKSKEIRKKLMIYSAILKNIMEPIVVLLIVVLLIINYKVFGKSIQESMMLVFVFYRTFNQFYRFQFTYHKFTESSGSLSVVYNFVSDFDLNSHTKKTSLKLEKLNDKVLINIKNLIIGYEFPISKEINIKIKEGELVSIIGESGTGKSTLSLMIAGVLVPYKGEIFYNRKYLKSLNNTIGYVPQEPFIFEGSVKDNITLYSQEISEDLVIKALKDVGLLDFFDKYQGIYTMLGSDGIEISGGQKQRLSIARELVKNVQILILDEITSALDPKNEELLNNTIIDIKRKTTIINITHKYNILKYSDSILDLEEFRIIK